jgi:hypothetical protein
LQPEPLLYLGIPEELRSDPRALMMYRYGHNAPSVYADPSGLNGEPQVEDGMIQRDAPPEEVEERTWVVWPDEFAGTTFIEQVIRSTSVGGGPTSAVEKERRASEVSAVQASVKEAAALAVVAALVGAIRVVNDGSDASAVAGRRPPNMTPSGAGRTGAFNEAKRRNGIPTSQQPVRITPNYDKRGNPQSGRQYHFEVPAEGGGVKTIIIRDDAAGDFYGPNHPQNRGPHFNDPMGNHYDY